MYCSILILVIILILVFIDNNSITITSTQLMLLLRCVFHLIIFFKMSASAIVDALPYVDQEYDVPALRETVSESA